MLYHFPLAWTEPKASTYRSKLPTTRPQCLVLHSDAIDIIFANKSKPDIVFKMSQCDIFSKKKQFSSQKVSIYTLDIDHGLYVYDPCGFNRMYSNVSFVLAKR